jgi:hypothetical protein
MSGAHNKEHDAVVSRIRKKLEDVGCMTIHLKSYVSRGRRTILTGVEPGWPDIFCFRPDGTVEFFEVKTGTGRIEPEQRKKFSELVRHGFRVTIIKGPLMAREIYKWKKIEN